MIQEVIKEINMKLRRGMRLLTKDGRKTGNAIILGICENKYVCESDFGNIFLLSNIDNYHIGVPDMNCSDKELNIMLQDWYESRSNRVNGCKDPIIVINQITCKYCDSTIISRHRHDFVICECGKVAVDGGNSYLRRQGESGKDYIEQSVLIERNK